MRTQHLPVHRSRPATSTGTLLVLISIAVAASGCSTPAIPADPDDPAESSSPSPSASPGTLLDDLGFDEGALLPPDAIVGWNFAIDPDNPIWRIHDDVPPGVMEFVMIDGTCSARYIQEIIETAAADDRTASDEFLAALHEDTVAELAPHVFDATFALTNDYDGSPALGAVATVAVLSGTPGSTIWLVAVRVFTAIDPAAAGMNNAYTLEMSCEDGVDPQLHVSSLDGIAKIAITG